MANKDMHLKIPPLLLTIIMIFGMWLAEPLCPKIYITPAAVIGMTLVSFALGVCFVLLGAIEFRKANTTVDPIHIKKANTLVTSGIYKVSRNPMYVGFALLLIAYAIFSKAPILLLGAIIFILYINKFQIIPEEAFMLEKFGDQYNRYKSEVRRWI